MSAAAGDPAFAPAAEIARRVARGETSARAVTAAFLDRIAELDPGLHAFTAVLAESALEEAERVDASVRSGRPAGPLAGVPVAIKDLVDVAGVPTGAGAHPRFRAHPQADAPLVARIRAAQGVVVGKTNLHELAYGVTNVNVHEGPTLNPWNPDHVPGGSSGGSAAAVAAGLCPLAVGTDTGGSIRIPAALCGVVGLKPTFGAVPLAGVFPLGWSLDHAGPIARSVDDAALLFEVMAGRAPTSAAAAPPPARAPLAGVRIGVPRPFFWEALDPEVARAAEAALEVLRGLGATVEETAIPFADRAGAAMAIIQSVEATALHEARLRAHPEAFGREVRARLDRGFFVPGTMLVRAQRARAFLTRAFVEALSDFDACVMPATAEPAPTLARSEAAAAGRAPSLSVPLTRLTNPFNLTGCPAASVPCGFTAAGLPVGLQIAARPHGEASILAVARAYERATPWHDRRPPLAPARGATRA